MISPGLILALAFFVIACSTPSSFPPHSAAPPMWSAWPCAASTTGRSALPWPSFFWPTELPPI